METVIRKLQKIWGACCCRRQRDTEEEYGGYTLLSDEAITLEKSSKEMKQSKEEYGGYTLLSDEAITLEKSSKEMKQSKEAPAGCFVVCVGPERKRFVINIEHANHPRFMALLEDAEKESGKSIHNDGPIYLPCDVDLFSEALTEMIIADFDSSVTDSATSSYRSGIRSWARRLFKIPRSLRFRRNNRL